ncbi:MAG: aminotransferase class I/II-fold pyridoxal phosphate-dependent enzyme [Planctomycetes bacterium]|nr:aminotransferase class I/II-fold pyridoxal phosphate-dependent enzyme [Planctomycetota bacterium]
MTDLARRIRGRTTREIAAAIESAARDGALKGGGRLPTVRGLAETLGVSPATVAAAYKELRRRGVLVARGRQGTRLSHVPRLPRGAHDELPTGARNLRDGNPDPALLPSMAKALRRIDATPHLYGGAASLPALQKLVAKDLLDEGVRVGGIAFVSGAMDGIERVLAEELHPGDCVAVEDPCFGNVHEVVLARGLVPLAVPIDDEGVLPDGVERALAQGARALIVTPRAQNPYGSAFTPARAKALRAILRTRPDVVVIEDDHASLITRAELAPIHVDSRRWAHVRSLSKGLNPDLRLAALTGDDETMRRVEARQRVGERWVSHVLQRIAVELLSDASVRRGLRKAADTYVERREALLAALATEGVRAFGRSGYNVWIPVESESATIAALLARGFAVAPGERFRMQSAPAVRATTATLAPRDAKLFARELAAATRAVSSAPSV